MTSPAHRSPLRALVLAVALTTSAGTAAAQADSATIAAADRGRVLGAESAKVWLLVVSDFQCPYCKAWHDSTFPALKKDYVNTGKVRVAYINFPLEMHANAIPAAMAAMCAGVHGKFWETADRIFATQKQWQVMPQPLGYLDSLATSSGIGLARQRMCSAPRALASLITADKRRMERLGVESTPVFFVGQRQILGAQPLKVFRQVLDSALAASARK